MRDAVIVESIRTPIGRRGGSLSAVHPADLSAIVLNAVVERAGVSPDQVDDVVWGCVTQSGEQSSNIARNSVLAAGWPEAVPGTTVDRQCGSGQQALHFAAGGVIAGHYDIAVAGGVECMSRVPMGAAASAGPGSPISKAIRGRYAARFNQGLGAEMIAAHWGLSRSRLDEYSLESHVRSARAIDEGALSGQLIAVDREDAQLAADEGVRRDSTLEKLSELKPAFAEDGRITAGNSSQISDGASALLITTSERASTLGLRPLARVHTSVVVGSDPVMMLTGPIPATEKILAKSGLTIDDIGAFEVNEAFASVVLAWQDATGAKPERVNPLGGAISVGHPLGGSGGVLTARLLNHMRDNGIQYGLQTMCEGGGMANATIFELISN